MHYPLYEFGGSGPVITVAIASGFPPETYRPLLDPLTDRYRVVCMLPRALWPDPPPPESLTSWYDLADDLLAGLHEHGLENVIAIGHSMGGVASMLAALAEPSRFRGLILVDPTILPPAFVTFIHIMVLLGQGRRSPVVQGALRRRTRFTGPEEAFAYWRPKPLFRGWSDETLWLYVEGLTRPAPDGGIELRWSPAWEARYYEKVMTTVWREIPRLRGLLPVLAVRGVETNSFVERSYRKFQRLVPQAVMAEIAGHGHLFPQSAPDETRRIIETWLANLKG